MKSTFRTVARRGFTLIELIITIVIIGILAAVAIPKFQDLTNEANLGVVRGAAAAIASATSVNYAKRQVNPPSGGFAIPNCAAIQTNLAALADVPAGTTVAGAGITLTDGTAQDCTVTLGAVTVTVKMYGST